MIDKKRYYDLCRKSILYSGKCITYKIDDKTNEKIYK